MTTLTRTQSLDHLSKNIYCILLEKTIIKLQLFSVIDLISYFILASISSIFLCPLSFLNLLNIFGARTKNTCLLNMGFIFNFSNIPVKVILIIYYKTVVSIILGIISIINASIIIYYNCKTLSLISNKHSDIELTVQSSTHNPYLSSDKPPQNTHETTL